MSLPGQEAGSPDLEAGYKFPSLDSLGLQLVTVLDTLHIKQVTWVLMEASKSISILRLHSLKSKLIVIPNTYLEKAASSYYTGPLSCLFAEYCEH